MCQKTSILRKTVTMSKRRDGQRRVRGKDQKPRKKTFGATLDSRVPLTKRQANRFANGLRYYLELNRGLRITSVRFDWWEGAEIFKAFVKTERRKSGVLADVFESIGGPEVSLVVNGSRCTTWMLACDSFNFVMLQKYFLEVAQVVEYTLTGTWEFHNAVLCCEQWADDRGATVSCCTG